MSGALSFPEPPDGWTARYSLRFAKQLGDRPYRHRQEFIFERLVVLFRDPYRAARAERLRHPYRGLRSARVDDRLRFVYRLCEECRRDGERRLRPLDCCIGGFTDDRTVNVLCLSGHYGDIPEDFAF